MHEALTSSRFESAVRQSFHSIMMCLRGKVQNVVIIDPNMSSVWSPDHDDIDSIINRLTTS